jgi:hypothetical protein
MTEEGLSGGEIAAAVIGSLVGFALLFAGLIFLLRIWMRGPTKGTDNKKKLDGKVSVLWNFILGILEGKVSLYC